MPRFRHCWHSPAVPPMLPKKARPPTGDTCSSRILAFRPLPLPTSPEAASEAGWVRVGRYAATRPGPTEAQRHPLQAVVHLQFPRQVRTVGRAVDYALRRSGYQLTSGVGPLQDRALPEVHRSLGPMTIEQTLKTLAGPAYALHVNERLRTIAFVPVPSESSPATGSPGKHAPSRVAALDRRGPAVSARQYGPVRTGETLFPIATRLSQTSATQGSALT